MKKGFTLVELMVVIAIIALLTGIILVNLTGSKAKGRDTQRASDLAQMQAALEYYFDRCNQYPTSFPTNPTTMSAGCPFNNGVQVTLGDFISRIPVDPSTKAAYGYAVNATTPPTDYVLYTTFESSNSVLSQSAPNPSGTWFTTGTFDCSDAAHFHYCTRPN